MPYITEARKKALEKHAEPVPANAGELNWSITMLLQSYIKEHGECYQTYNDIMGALEGAKLELYRRKISVYEDRKIDENGDVY